MLEKIDARFEEVLGIGIANQRETVVLWDWHCGRVLCNAIVWCDVRNAGVCEEVVRRVGGDKDYFKGVTGLPISTYFSAFKLKWLAERDPIIADRLKKGTVKIGTIDSWLIYKLTG